MEEIDEFVIPIMRIVCLLTDSVSEFTDVRSDW